MSKLTFLIVPHNTPYLWARAQDVVAVAGDLSRTELFGVTESLGER